MYTDTHTRARARAYTLKKKKLLQTTEVLKYHSSAFMCRQLRRRLNVAKI